MNKTAIKNFAIWARVQLIEAAKQRAYEYEITENGDNKPSVDAIGGRLLSKNEKEQCRQLIEQIRQKGYNQVMEEAAYTWFNRFIALRFMEVNGYLPSKVRVFTDENGAFRPEILKQAMIVELEGLNRSKVFDLLDKQNNEELYKYLLITQCNALSDGLPYMFEKIANWTELLFPKNLLRPDSVLGQMISSIPEEDWTDAVQIIGWMYQYYNSELKDETFALLKKNVKITKERIPAATQLFTPDWIVRYMVENSLGRLWYEGHNDFDKSMWKYYLDKAEQEPEVEEQLKKIRAEYAAIRPEEIKVIDPCMGSGHILVYAFDVLMQIYTSAGWSERDAARSIIENNLYGLDIDDRAGQLAYFAVMMKARKYSRRILNGEVKPNVLSIHDSNWMTDEFISYVAGENANMKADLVMLRKTFKDAKEYGSILNVPAMNYDALYERIDILRRSFAEDLIQGQYRDAATEQLLPLVKQSQIMSQKYDVVVTNPPYMGSSGMSAKLGDFIKDNYPDSKSDMSTVCMERCTAMCNDYGYMAMINIPVWMFLSSYEKLRYKQLENNTYINMVHPGRGIFGSDFGTIAFVMAKRHIPRYIGNYRRLFVKQGEVETIEEREKAFLEGRGRYTATQDNFSKIPGSPVAYWVSDAFLKTFNSQKLESIASTNNGFTTGDNNLFLRMWFEVEIQKFDCSNPSFDSLLGKKQKWFPYNKGGDFRKWYGNNDYVINWGNNGAEIKSYGHLVPRSMKYQFRESVTWNKITSGTTAFRYKPTGTMFDVGGLSLFTSGKNNLFYLLALCNSVYVKKVLEIISPTLNCETGHIAMIPVVFDGSRDIVQNVVECNIQLSKVDWDSFETSWDFKKHPLI